MAEQVVLSSDQGDADDRLVTSSGRRIRDTELVASDGALDWGVMSPSVLRRVVMTQDASNSFSLSTSGQFLRATASGAGGNQREAYLFPDSLSVNSEIDSLIGYAGSISAGVAQWGNLHQVYRDTSGVWHAVACWTDTTLAIVPLLNFGVITFTGASAMNINNFGNNPIAQALDVLRYVTITRAQRATNVVTAIGNSASLPPVGATGDVVGMAAAGFNATGVTITGVNQTNRSMTWAQTAGDATDADAGGRFQPATKWAANPIRLRSRLQGNVLSGYCYRPEEGKPDWTDTSRVTSYTLSGGSPAFVAAEGALGYWFAHIESGNTLDFGGTTWKRLPS